MPVIESSAGEGTRLVIGQGTFYLTLQIERDLKAETARNPTVLLDQRDALRLAIELVRRSEHLEDVKVATTKRRKGKQV